MSLYQGVEGHWSKTWHRRAELSCGCGWGSQTGLPLGLFYLSMLKYHPEPLSLRVHLWLTYKIKSESTLSELFTLDIVHTEQVKTQSKQTWSGPSCSVRDSQGLSVCFQTWQIMFLCLFGDLNPSGFYPNIIWTMAWRCLGGEHADLYFLSSPSSVSTQPRHLSV